MNVKILSECYEQSAIMSFATPSTKLRIGCIAQGQPDPISREASGIHLLPDTWRTSDERMYCSTLSPAEYNLNPSLVYLTTAYSRSANRYWAEPCRMARVLLC